MGFHIETVSKSVDGPEETRGGVKGSFPVYRGYGPYQYVNWGTKFTVDSNLFEQRIRPQGSDVYSPSA